MSVYGLFSKANAEKRKATLDIKKLVRALSSKKSDTKTKLEALDVLKDVKNNEAIMALIEALMDNDSTIRLKSAEALIAAGELAFEALTDALEYRARIQKDWVGAAYPSVPPMYVYGVMTFVPDSQERHRVKCKTEGRMGAVSFGKSLGAKNKHLEHALQKGEIVSILPETSSINDVRWAITEILRAGGGAAAEFLAARLESQQDFDQGWCSISWALVEMSETAVPALLSSLLRFAEKAQKPIFNTVIMATIAVILRKPGAKSLSTYIQQRGTFSDDSRCLLLRLASLIGNDTIRDLKDTLASGTPIGRISLWAANEQIANQIQTDRFYLIGALMQESSEASKQFLEHIDQGVLSFKVVQNRSRGGYDIDIVLHEKV